MDQLVTQSSDVAWGAAVIAGTRVPVQTLFDYLKRASRAESSRSEGSSTLTKRLPFWMLGRTRRRCGASTSTRPTTARPAGSSSTR